jgi:hypothetical protein
MVLNRDEYKPHLTAFTANHFAARTYPVAGVMAVGTGREFGVLPLQGSEQIGPRDCGPKGCLQNSAGMTSDDPCRSEAVSPAFAAACEHNRAASTRSIAPRRSNVIAQANMPNLARRCVGVHTLPHAP